MKVNINPPKWLFQLGWIIINMLLGYCLHLRWNTESGCKHRSGDCSL